MTPGAISVVVPVRDRPALLERAIASVLAQTCPVGEIVVVDDGSRPPVDIVPLERHDPRIRVIRLNGDGAAAARNAGIRAARHDWVAFLDSDDRWLPDKIARQIYSIGAAGAAAGLLAAHNLHVRRPGRADHLYNHSLPRMPLSEWILIDGGTLQTSTLLLRRADALAIGFDETLRRHQDWDFALRHLRSGARLVYDPSPLAIYDAGSGHARMSARVSVDETLAWFAQAGDLLTPRARLSFYLRALLPVALRHTPLRACVRLLRLGRACPGAAGLIARTLGRAAVDRLQRAAAGSALR